LYVLLLILTLDNTVTDVALLTWRATCAGTTAPQR
jgi:hypothetical protein